MRMDRKRLMQPYWNCYLKKCFLPLYWSKLTTVAKQIDVWNGGMPEMHVAETNEGK